MMKSHILLLATYIILGYGEENPSENSDRDKRSAVGALHIVTNHVQPIHADVKSEGDGTDKPCNTSHRPSKIESGVGFQVIPPEDTVYTVKSLRKSLPLHTGSPTTLDLVRSVSRIVTVAILFVSGIVEFYPTFRSLVMTIYNFIFNQ